MRKTSTTCIKILMHIACKAYFQGWAIQGAVPGAWASAAAGQGQIETARMAKLEHNGAGRA